MSKFLISLEASRDLNEIVDYFAANSLDAGDRFIAAFNQKCQHLAQFPNIGKRYPNLHPSMRGISFKSYIIFYEVVADGIIIARVVSGYRNLLSLFEGTEK
jgi:toxin ParE1/3/4